MTELSTLKMFKAAGPNGKDMMTVCPLARPLAAPYQEGLQCILQEKKKYLKSEKLPCWWEYTWGDLGICRKATLPSV